MAKNKNKQRKEKRKKSRERKQLQMTTTGGTWKKELPACHTGATILHKVKDGGALMIGGWKGGQLITSNTFVIDLTGDEDRFDYTPKAHGERANKMLKNIKPANAGWLSLPFPDYGVPKNITTYEQWHGMTMDIKELLEQGIDVLVCCLGGHGRSGTFCSIVSYILDPIRYADPVKAIRTIHCDQAVETEAQEQFIYDVLGLDLIIDGSYYWTDYDNRWMSYGKPMDTFEKCPMCATSSLYVKSNGMCLSCQSKYNNAPEVMDITVDMMQSEKTHQCDNQNCLGIYKAKVCGHLVHDKIIIDGYCEECVNEQNEAEKMMKAKEGKTETSKEILQTCPLCGIISINVFYNGLCYSCETQYQYACAEIHDTLTDSYTDIHHDCHYEKCKGIVQADVCSHVVHNRDIQDGLCPRCLSKKQAEEVPF